MTATWVDNTAGCPVLVPTATIGSFEDAEKGLLAWLLRHILNAARGKGRNVE